MISAGFVHLLGTAMKDLDPVGVFPLAPFLCGLGFILTLLADQAATVLTGETSGESSLPCGQIPPSPSLLPFRLWLHTGSTAHIASHLCIRPSILS